MNQLCLSKLTAGAKPNLQMLREFSASMNPNAGLSADHEDERGLVVLFISINKGPFGPPQPTGEA